MKVLYAVQGTGNGHLSRAMDMIPCLKNRAEVDVLISGIQADLVLPFEVKYRMHGLSFIFGKSGGVNIWETFMRSKVLKLIREINELPVSDYDLVISDFEPVSAWACNLRDQECIGLSHQVAVLDRSAPKPAEIDILGRFILKNYAPPTVKYGFHFQSYNQKIYTPIIRQQIRNIKPTDLGHYTVYLPSYSDERLLEYLGRFREVKWQIFSKHNKGAFHREHMSIEPINGDRFVESMASAKGVLCGAGFETPAEALFLGKKLMVLPMKNQYEQHLNAAALQELGVPILKNLKPEHDSQMASWLTNEQVVQVDYPDQTQEIVDMILDRHLWHSF